MAKHKEVKHVESKVEDSGHAQHAGKSHAAPVDKPKWKCCGRWNIWKLVALAVVVLFVIILIGGLVKLYHFKSRFADATVAQMDKAEELVKLDLQARGLNDTAYKVVVSQKVHSMDKDGVKKDVLQVYAYDAASKHQYMVDIGEGMIVMHSETDTYGWMAQQKSGRREGCGKDDNEDDDGREMMKQCEMPGRLPGGMWGWHRK